MDRPAVFFDRDNTLIVSDGYLGDPEEIVLIEGAAHAVARARALGFATVIFSNQSGVARGLFDEEAVHAVNARLDEMLTEANPQAIIDRHEFCPDHPEAKIEKYRKQTAMRKPGPGMILQAAAALALDLSRSWVIGDAPRDIEAGKTAGCRTILFQDPALPASPAAVAASAIAPDFKVQTFNQALDIIEKNMAPTIATTTDPARSEKLLEQILQRMQDPAENVPPPFSVTRLFAGIVQIVALAVWFLAFVNRATPQTMWIYFTSAIMLQLFTIALLLMGRAS